ncbi:hypothetical protein BCR42DRAFT_443157 [Absidia repens]|uniref:Uncharacterized protein n=1 Tax=Absidia repens TaxID=90262 RepID=A0A1X2HZZ5_9FUNG|nr:hypothetical protein BCR42DRAFT_443157 [Absidia repens]
MDNVNEDTMDPTLAHHGQVDWLTLWHRLIAFATFRNLARISGVLCPKAADDSCTSWKLDSTGKTHDRTWELEWLGSQLLKTMDCFTLYLWFPSCLVCWSDSHAEYPLVLQPLILYLLYVWVDADAICVDQTNCERRKATIHQMTERS